MSELYCGSEMKGHGGEKGIELVHLKLSGWEGMEGGERKECGWKERFSLEVTDPFKS